MLKNQIMQFSMLQWFALNCMVYRVSCFVYLLLFNGQKQNNNLILINNSLIMQTNVSKHVIQFIVHFDSVQFLILTTHLLNFVVVYTQIHSIRIIKWICIGQHFHEHWQFHNVHYTKYQVNTILWRAMEE